MNETVLAEFIASTFIPFLPFIGSGVTAFILVIMFLVMFRGFMPEDR